MGVIESLGQNGIRNIYPSIRGMKIQSKLLLSLLPLVVLILIATGYITHWFSDRFLKEALGRTVKLQVLATVHELELVLQDALNDLEALSNSRAVSLEDWQRTLRRGSVMPYAEIGVLKKDPQGSLIAMANAEGSLIAITGKAFQWVADQVTTAHANHKGSGSEGKLVFQFVDRDQYGLRLEYPNLELRSILRILKPIYDDNNFLEKLVFLSIPATRLRNILSIYNSGKSPIHGYARTPENRYMYFLDKDGWILFESADPDRPDIILSNEMARVGLTGSIGKTDFKSAFLPQSTHYAYWKIVDDIRNNSNGLIYTDQVDLSIKTKYGYIAYAPVKLGLNSNQVIGGIVYVDKSKLPVLAGYRHMDVMFIITLSSILLMASIVILVSRLITKPILRLSKAVDEIKVTNKIAPIEMESYDYETSLLKDSINHFLETIKDQMEEIRIRDTHIIRASLMERVNLDSFEVPTEGKDPVPEIFGNSHAIRRLKQEILNAASSDQDVLITGETGTGKQLTAEAIHRLSSRSQAEFVSINCGALDENLLLDALFGHVKGAFTEARTERKGAFLSASGGTLFLDEIATASPRVQQALLRAISMRKIRPLGSDQERDVDVRVVAATNRDLRELCQEGLFREDLYFRLNVIHLVTPPLRERKEDIPLLVASFLQKYSKVLGKEALGISHGALNVLMEYDWPGNVRELENCLKNAAVMARQDVIMADELNITIRGNPETNSHEGFDKPLVEIPQLNERQKMLLKVLREQGEITRAGYQKIMDNNLPARTAIYDLQHLVDMGIITRIGKGPATKYRIIAPYFSLDNKRSSEIKV